MGNGLWSGSKSALGYRTVTFKSSLTEFDRLELDGIKELFKECIDLNFEKNTAKHAAYPIIGNSILQTYWEIILSGSMGEYDEMIKEIRENLYKLDPNLIFFCIINELETTQLYNHEDQFEIVQKLMFLTYNTYCNENINQPITK